MTDRRFFMLTGTVLAIAIAVSLYFISNNFSENHEEAESVENNREDYVDAYIRSLNEV